MDDLQYLNSIRDKFKKQWKDTHVEGDGASGASHVGKSWCNGDRGIFHLHPWQVSWHFSSTQYRLRSLWVVQEHSVRFLASLASQQHELAVPAFPSYCSDRREIEETIACVANH